jgi:acyl-CoA thioester hydrolase
MHRTPVRVRWSDLDPYRHVNHAAYLTYLEHARISALEEIGWGMQRLSDAGYQVVVVGIEVGFRRPAGAGDDLVVETWVEEIRTASSRWRQQITRGDELILQARIRAAATTLGGRPARAPADLNEALKRLAG